MAFEPLNWNLIKNPLNWAIVLLMLLLATVAGHLLLTYFGIEPETATSSATPSTVGQPGAQS